MHLLAEQNLPLAQIQSTVLINELPKYFNFNQISVNYSKIYSA